MRYPVGQRDTFEAVIDAARESASLTGIRYRVMIVTVVKARFMSDEPRRRVTYYFRPAELVGEPTDLAVEL